MQQWGEYSTDVQLVLQRSALAPAAPGGPQRLQSPPPPHRDLRKSLTFSGGHGGASRRVQVGVPPPRPARPPLPPPYEVVRGHPPPPPAPRGSHNQWGGHRGNKDVYGELRPSGPRGPRPRELPPYRDPPPPISPQKVPCISPSGRSPLGGHRSPPPKPLLHPRDIQGGNDNHVMRVESPGSKEEIQIPTSIPTDIPDPVNCVEWNMTLPSTQVNLTPWVFN